MNPDLLDTSQRGLAVIAMVGGSSLCEPAGSLQTFHNNICTPAMMYYLSAMRLFTLLFCIIASAAAFTTAPHCATNTRLSRATTAAERNMQSRLIKPTSLEARLNGDDEDVKVVEMDVDAFTLTAVGFGLIAFNFLVLANVSIVIQFISCYHFFTTRLQDPNFNVLNSKCALPRA